MRFFFGMLVLNGVLLLNPAWSGEPSGTYFIVMQDPSPYYTPTVATVTVGNPIQWNNKTATVHTVTHDACLNKTPCLFDSGSVGPGKGFSLSLSQPGTYSYYCRLHPIMRGTIVVKSQEM